MRSFYTAVAPLVTAPVSGHGRQVDVAAPAAPPSTRSPVGRWGLTGLACAQVGQLLVLGVSDWIEQELAPGIFIERALPVLYGAGLLVTAIEFAALARLARLRSVGAWSLAAVVVGVLAWTCFIGAWFIHRLIPLGPELHPAFWVSFAGGLLNTPYVILLAIALHRARSDLAARLSPVLLAILVALAVASLAVLVARRLTFLVPAFDLQASGALDLLASGIGYATPAVLLLLAMQLAWTRGTHLP